MTFNEYQEKVLEDEFTLEAESILERFQAGDLPNSTSIISTLIYKVYQYQNNRVKLDDVIAIFPQVEGEINQYIEHYIS